MTDLADIKLFRESLEVYKKGGKRFLVDAYPTTRNGKLTFITRIFDEKGVVINRDNLAESEKSQEAIDKGCEYLRHYGE